MGSPEVPESPIHVCFGEFELDEGNARLLRGGSAVALSPTPFGLLCALARRPGTLLTKHALLDRVWGHRFVSDSVLKGAISDVRLALQDDPQQPRYIETVPRRGYRFIAALSSATKAVPPKPHAPSNSRRDQAEPAFGQTPFVGRARELALLQRGWERSQTGTRVMFWIAGEPGIGKTTLIEHFVSGLNGSTCARGACVQHHGAGEPYHPILEALADLCRLDDGVPTMLRSVAPTWMLQLPWLSSAEQRETLRRELIGVNAERMLREMGEFLDRYSLEHPLVLVTEDLHWADRATIQLIDYVARRRGRGNLMWLCSFRLAEVVASNHPLGVVRHELHLRGLCEEIVLDSFSEAEVAEYLSQRSPITAADESVVRALHERTEGVPLFVASLAAGDLSATSLMASSALPENLSAIIEGYAASLGSDRRLLLSAAAVCGAEFHVDTVARALERDYLSVADVCEQLRREQLWLIPGTSRHDSSRPSSYSFRHALFRQVLYDRLAPSARAELHRKVGGALEQQKMADSSRITAAELAMHFDRGAVPMVALKYYAEAAEAALMQLSPVECLSLTERALNVVREAEAGVERDSLDITLNTLRAAAAFHLWGAGDQARDAYQRGASRLASVPGHPMSGLLLHGLGFLHNLRAEYAEALAVAERAESLIAEDRNPFLPLAAFTVRGQAFIYQGQPEAACKWLERALPFAQVVDTSQEPDFTGFIADPEVTILAMLGMPLINLGRISAARERLRTAYERARKLGQPMALMVTLWVDALCAIRLGEAARVGQLAEELQAVVEEHSLAQGRLAAQWFRGWAMVRRGNPLDGFQRIRAAYESNRATGMITGASETLGYAAEALLIQGDLGGAEEQLRQAFEIVNAYGERSYLPQLLLIDSGIARAHGQIPESNATIRRAIGEARSQGAEWLELLAMIQLCEHRDATVEEQHSLAALVERLGAGIDAPVIREAHALSEKIRST